MPPKPDMAALKKSLVTSIQQARSKPISFAYLMGKDGPVFETDPRKNPSVLWAAARKQGGGNKGAYGSMSFEGGRLILRCEDEPLGTLTKSFKDYLSSLGQTLRFTFLAPGAEADEEDEEGGDEDTPDDLDPALIITKARKRPMNVAWLIAKEGLVMRAHMRKTLDTLFRLAKADGAQPRGALGVMNVSGKVITLSCAEAPPGAFPKLAKRWLSDNGLMFKVRIELPNGDSMESEDDDAPVAVAAQTSDEPASIVAPQVPLAERLVSVGRLLNAAETVLDAKQHASLAGLFKQAAGLKDTDPGKAIKMVKLLEGRLAGLNLPEPQQASAKQSSDTPMPAAFAAPPVITDPVEELVKAVTPERKSAIDTWLQEFGEYENGWQFYDDEGGEYVAEALLGKVAALGGLTEAEKVYLAREAARMWRKKGSGENIQEAIDGIGDDPAARRALALGFASATADIARIHVRGQQTIESSDGVAARYLMMEKAVGLDPAATIEAFAGAEGELGRLAAGINADWMSRGRQKGLLDAVGSGAVDPQKSDLMTSAIFLSTQESDMGDRAYRGSLAKALGRVAGGDDSAATAAKLEGIFATSGAQEMMFGEAITPELRNWALAQAANNPDFTAASLADGWESEVAAKAVAGPIAEKYLSRGLDPFTLRTNGPTGALHNSIGQALGIAPSNLPPENETEAERQAREAAGLDHDYYAGDERVAKISAMVAQVGGDPAQMTVLPVVVTSNDFGVASFTVFRLERPEGPRFVDDMGNKYDSVEKWLELNLLPPGKMTYPETLVLGAKLVTVNTPLVVDSLSEWLGIVGDGVALAAGITVGVIAIAGSGGLATPLVVAGAGAAAWQVGRAGDRMYDDHQRGKDITDLTDPSVRGNWLEAGAGVLSVGAMGAAVRSARLVQSGAKVTQVAARTTAGLQIASDATDALAMGDQAMMMAQNWDRMGNGDKAMGLLNIAFWGGMGAASTKAGGAMMQDALSFTRLRNQAEFGSPFSVNTHPDMHDGQIRTAYDLDVNGRPVNVRIETGGGKVDPALLALHSNAGRQIEASSGLTARLKEILMANPNPKPGTQGWEAKLEIEKIGAENDLLRQKLANDGARMTPLERESLLRRQQELAEASDFHMARLQDPAAMGQGWVAAPSEGHNQAAGLGWPTGNDLPAGHHWVGNPNGEPTLRRSDGTIERFTYDPVKKVFKVHTGDARVMSTVGHGDNEISFAKDADGNTVEATATLRRYHVNADRSPDELAAQRAVGAKGTDTDDAGHMIGHRFGLDQGMDNLFPQNANFNRGAYKTLENELAGWIAAGGEVRISVKVKEFTGGRPAKVEVSYEVIDPKTGKAVYDNQQRFNNDGQQSFTRVSTEDINTKMATQG